MNQTSTTLSPTFVASDDTEHLIHQVKHAYDNKTPIIIEGNGTKRFLGHHIDTRHPIISTREHSGIINYEPVELVMTARAGTTLAEIDAVLAENQQMLACDPARFNGQATIGGSLATNQAGPSRPWAGSLRDHVLGVNLINGKGEHLRFGGKVMKNVAGYDVSRLQAGAMGTLGLMTEISFKVLPCAKAKTTVRQALSQADAINMMNQLSGQPTPLSGAAWLEGWLYLQFSGAQTAVDKARDTHINNDTNTSVLSATDADIFWAQLRDQQLDFFNDLSSNEPLWRFSVNSSAWDSLNEEMNNNNWLVDWGGALRWLKGNFDSDKLSAWAQAHGGEVTLYRTGKDHEKTASQGGALQMVLPPTNSVTQRIQTHIKNSFDPNNIFNNGRLYHWM